MLLLDLLRLFIFFIFHCLFKLLSLNVFVCLHVWVEYHPLSGFEREVRHDGWVCLKASISNWKIERLGRSFLEIELVPERLLDGCLITLSRSFIWKLLFENFINIFKKLLVPLLLILPVVFLILCLLSFFFHEISIEIVMECQHIDLIINLVHSIFKRVCTNIVRCLRVVCSKCLDHGFILFFLGEL